MILITGVKGQLGSCIANYLMENHIFFTGVDREEFDITNRKRTLAFIRRTRPDCIIHCSAYSNVDAAEEEQELCIKTNMEGTENIAIACQAIDAKLLYISSDYVFDGEKKTPYVPEDKAKPLSVYGFSKAMGEQKVKQLLTKHFIVRTSWLFGKNSPNFVETMLRLGREKNRLFVVNDQIGSPTYTEDLAPLLIELLNSEKYGSYHATNEGFCSWAEFARGIMESSGLSCEIVPVLSREYSSKAVRPQNSRLDKDKLSINGFKRLPTWQSALHRYINDREEKGDGICSSSKK